ncbi:hypothetical protein SUDANB146_02082 [Streptomyces sp. enrichment culture]
MHRGASHVQQTPAGSIRYRYLSRYLGHTL